ncbi:MAG: PD-(D/E)XK nuclease-like domain-containing protein [Verrucomicrobiota bacterium]
MPTGVHHDIPDADYRNAVGVSNSMLKVLRERWSPEYAQLRLKTPKETTEAFAFGKAIHASLLTPDVKPTWIVAPEGMSFRTKEGKAWKEAQQKGGLDVIQFDGNYGGTRLTATIKKFKSHALAMSAIGDGKPEVSCFAPYNCGGTVMRKMRADWVCTAPTIVDLKTSMDCSPKCVGKRDEFSSSLYDLDYDMQAAFYLDTYNDAKPEDRKENFVFVAMDWDEDTGYVGIRVLQCDETVIKSGREKYTEALIRWIEAEQQGWKTGYNEDVTMLSVPEYIAKKYRSF